MLNESPNTSRLMSATKPAPDSKVVSDDRGASPPCRKGLNYFDVHPGNFRFFCNRRIIMGPDSKALAVTMLMIVIPCVLFSVFTCPDLCNRTSISVMGALVFSSTISVIMLIWTAITDPGIVPRAPVVLGANGKAPKPPRFIDVVLNGSVVKLRYCSTCRIYKPPRSSHCRICDTCIDRFDHHCPWIGTCIGKRNYPQFTFFLISVSFSCLYLFSVSASHLVLIAKDARDHNDATTWEAFVTALSRSPVSFVLAVYTFVLAWFVTGLCLFHMYLISTGRTTKEKIRGTRHSPYSRGLVGNCIDICCDSSILDPRTYATPNNSSSSSSSSSSLTEQAQPQLQQQAPAPAPTQSEAQAAHEQVEMLSIHVHNSTEPSSLAPVAPDLSMISPSLPPSSPCSSSASPLPRSAAAVAFGCPSSSASSPAFLQLSRGSSTRTPPSPVAPGFSASSTGHSHFRPGAPLAGSRLRFHRLHDSPSSSATAYEADEGSLCKDTLARLGTSLHSGDATAPGSLLPLSDAPHCVASANSATADSGLATTGSAASHHGRPTVAPADERTPANCTA